MSKLPTYTVAISGANGFVGSELVRYFSQQGWDVIGLVRQPVSSNNTQHIRYVEYDMTKQVSASIMKNCDFLIHTAYIKQDKQHSNAFDLNVNASKDLINIASENHLKKLVFISSMSAQDDAISVYGKQKCAIEKLFLANNAEVIRSGLIIGNGGIVRNMADFMKKAHVVPVIDGGRQPLQIVSIYNLANAIERVLMSNVNYGTLTIATPQVYQYKQLYKAIAKQLRVWVFFIPIPFYVLLVLLRTISFLCIPISINEENLMGLKKLRPYDTEHDLKNIGVTLDDLEIALSRTFS